MVAGGAWIIGDLPAFAERIDAGAESGSIRPMSIILRMFGFAVMFAAASPPMAAPAACPFTPVPTFRPRACQLPPNDVSWSEIRRALGVYRPERFGRSGDCQSPARKLIQAWSLLQRVELPGLGNAADYVDQNISSLAYDPRLASGLRAQYVQGTNTLLLGDEFFDSPNASDAERAGTLLHEARHAADRRYRHVICSDRSSLAWTQRCDHRFIAAPADPRAGAWSLEVTFHALLREIVPCLDRELMQRRIDSKLSAAFRIVTKAERSQLRVLAKAGRDAAWVPKLGPETRTEMHPEEVLH